MLLGVRMPPLRGIMTARWIFLGYWRDARNKQVFYIAQFLSLDHNGFWAFPGTLLDTRVSSRRCGVCSGFSTLTFVVAPLNIMNVVIELPARWHIYFIFMDRSVSVKCA